MLSARSRLSVMMFLQYFVWGSWAVSAGGYMGKMLHFNGPSIGLIYSTTAIGAIFAPLFVGYIADRFFSTERILATLHIVGGALLVAASFQTEVTPLFRIMVAYALCYMPTLALTNSISMANIGDPEKEFPRIRVFGTVGWIAAGLIVGILIGEEKNTFFQMAGAASVVLGLLCLALPHTPAARSVGRGRARTGRDQAVQGTVVHGLRHLFVLDLHSAGVLLRLCECLPGRDRSAGPHRAANAGTDFRSLLHGRHAVVHRAAGGEEHAAGGHGRMGGAIPVLLDA